MIEHVKPIVTKHMMEDVPDNLEKKCEEGGK